jgi:hypothetical protein
MTVPALPSLTLEDVKTPSGVGIPSTVEYVAQPAAVNPSTSDNASTPAKKNLLFFIKKKLLVHVKVLSLHKK